jgi:hypothetical protein
MLVKFGWGKDKDDIKKMYDCTDYNVTLMSGDEFAGKIGNMVPGQISVSLEVTPSQDTKPAIELFKFAKAQAVKTKSEGSGKITVYEGEDIGQAIQEISFEKAFFTDISSGASRMDKFFIVHLNISAANITISDQKFADKRKEKLVEGKV